MVTLFQSKEEKLNRQRQIVAEHCDPGEELLAVLLGYTVPSWESELLLGPLSGFTAKMYYVGLTHSDLLLIEHTALDEPVGFKRLPRGDIKSASVKHGMINDRLVLDLGHKKPLHLQVARRMRHQTDLIVSSLQGSAQGA